MVGALHVMQAGGDDDAAAMVFGHPLARQAAKVRQFGQRDVHAEGARTAAPCFHATQEVGRQRAGVDKPGVQQARIEIRHDGARIEALAFIRDDAAGAALVQHDFGHPASGADLDAQGLHRLRHGLGDGAHAADRVAPGALFSIDLAEHVVQQHIGRPGRVGTGVVAHHAVETIGGLDRIGLEPAVQDVARRLGEQVQQLALARQRQLAHAVAEAAGLEQLGQRGQPAALDAVRRRLQHQFAQQVGRAVQVAVVVVQAPGVALGEPGHFKSGPAGANLQVAAVVKRQEIGKRALDDAQAMPGQRHIVDHLGIEQRDGVRSHRVAKTRMELLGHRGAADDAAALEQRHLQPGAGQVPGADQAVMAGADDDCVAHLASPGACKRTRRF